VGERDGEFDPDLDSDGDDAEYPSLNKNNFSFIQFLT
jgi:hypothetical protein